MRIFILYLILLTPVSFAEKGVKAGSFELGKRAFEQGSYRRALDHLAAAIESAPDASTRNRAYYYQGLTLYELKLYYSSYLSFRNALLSADEKNREVYEKAIKNAVVITDRLHMVDTVGKVLDRLPKDYIPSSVSDAANYAIGMNALLTGGGERAAGLFKSINPQSQFYAKAIFALGVASTKQKNYKDAVFYFKKVRDLLFGKREMQDLAELARLNLARTYYSAGDMESSIHWYSQFNNTSPYWLTILLESAWPLMRANDTGVSLGNLHTVLSPYYREDLVGEGHVLRSTILYSLCKYEEMRRTLAQFFSLYDPVLRAMQSEASQFSNTDTIYQAYVSKKGINRSFVNFMSRDPGIRDLMRTQEALRRERANVARLGRNEQLRRMSNLIEEADKNLAREIGSILQKMHRHKLAELVELREQANYLKVEIVTGEKDLIEGQKGLPPKRIVDVETSVASGYDFWPFQGEYWEDELGSYVYTTESACVR